MADDPIYSYTRNVGRYQNLTYSVPAFGVLFSPSVGYTITSVDWLLSRGPGTMVVDQDDDGDWYVVEYQGSESDDVGTITVSLGRVTGWYPLTFTTLCSASMAGNDIHWDLMQYYGPDEDPPFTHSDASYNFDFGDGADITPGNYYAVIIETEDPSVLSPFATVKTTMDMAPHDIATKYGHGIYYSASASRWIYPNAGYWMYPTIVRGTPILSGGVDDITVFPPTRPEGYDPDLPWLPGDWTDDVYTPPEWGDISDYVATGGGRWGQHLVAVGKSKVYYESLT